MITTKGIKKGFTVAEALVAMVVIALILAVIAPIVSKSIDSPTEAPWKYITQGDLAQNAAVYTAPSGASVAVFGDSRVPIDSSVTENKAHVFSSKLNPKISVVARNNAFNPLISRHLIDFYEKADSGTDVTNIGKISFDGYYNLALGKNALDNANNTSLTSFNHYDYETLWTTVTEVNNTYLLAAANTAVGQYAMGGDRKNVAYDGTNEYPTRNLTGGGNTAVGAFALRRNTSGYLNTGIGFKALESTSDTTPGQGEQNVAAGAMALQNNITGNYNIAIGANALINHKTNQQNVAIGYNASYSDTDGEYNLAIGSNSLYSSTTAVRNFAIGNNAMYTLVTGNYNTAVGHDSLYTINNVQYNTAFGHNALNKNTAANNTAVGYNSLTKNTTGTSNTGVGYKALSTVTTKSSNTAVGYLALLSDTTGQNNTAIGEQALRTNTTGNDNVALGAETMKNNVNGGHNTALGTQALFNNNYGSYNTAAGYMALYSNTVGSYNVAIGYNAAGTVADESNKLYISANKDLVGTSALIYGDDTTDDRKIFFNVTGNNAYLGSETAGNRIVTQSVMESYVASHTAVDDSLSDNRLALSDSRLKNITGDNTSGLNEILQLKVKNYTMKNDKTNEPLVGVIAQELQKVFPNSVYEGKDGFLRITRDEIFYACVNAIKELHSMLQTIIAKIQGLQERLCAAENNLKIQDNKLQNLTNESKINNKELSETENELKSLEERLSALEKDN